MAIFWPVGVPQSGDRGTMGGPVDRRARSLLAVCDQLCQRFVLILCLDEIFFRREPILMAVEPHSLAWVAGQRGPDRSGASWGNLLSMWPCVERVITDAGTGLERGVKFVNAARAAAGQPIAMGLDVFTPRTSCNASCIANGGEPSGS